MRPNKKCPMNSKATITLIMMTMGLLIMSNYAEAVTTIMIDDPMFELAPYVWKSYGTGVTARAEATMPGAYVRAVFQGTTTIGLLVDATGSNTCPVSELPAIEYSIDKGPFKAIHLTQTSGNYILPLAEKLAVGQQHEIELYFCAGSLAAYRWSSPADHLRIAGIQLDTGGSLLPCSHRSKKAIGFGDSITEGIYAASCDPNIGLMNGNARFTWFPIICSALDCEYGQLGSAGQGMAASLSLPPLWQSWNRYDGRTISSSSRLTNGLLLPEPDYIFCAMGTNDSSIKAQPFIDAYLTWLTAMRQACPNTRFFCVVPPLGTHAADVQAAVTIRNEAGDQKVHLIDTAPLKTGFRVGQGATTLAYDGVHPSLYGHAMLSTLIAVEVQNILSREDNTQYTLTTSVVGGHGTVHPSDGMYAIGTVVSLTAVPDIGYRVKAWSGTDDVPAADSNTNTVTMNGNKTVTVEFEVIHFPNHLVSAVSRKVHGQDVGPQDIDVFAGHTESRSADLASATTDLLIIAFFDQPVLLVGSNPVLSTAGIVGTLTVDSNILQIPITGVSRTTALKLSFPGVAHIDDSAATSLSTLCIRMVVGDMDDNGRVTLTDFSYVKNAGPLNTIVTSATARYDVNLDGRINLIDFLNIQNAGLLNGPSITCP
jgi:hypothetical protein